jgi:hypothetical protein
MTPQNELGINGHCRILYLQHTGCDKASEGTIADEVVALLSVEVKINIRLMYDESSLNSVV